MVLPLPNFLLEDQIAVVTGGGGGIGRAVALAFAAAVAHVVVLDADRKAASRVSDEIGASGRAVAADVRDQETIERIFAEVALQHGRIDVLFNNAGINRRHSSLEMTVDDCGSRQHDRHVHLCTDSGSAHETRWSDRQTASTLGLSGGWYPNLAYQATKSAVVNMTRSWATE